MGIITDVQSSKISLGVPDEADAADTKVDFWPVLVAEMKAWFFYSFNGKRLSSIIHFTVERGGMACPSSQIHNFLHVRSAECRISGITRSSSQNERTSWSGTKGLCSRNIHEEGRRPKAGRK